MTILRVENISKTYDDGTQALKGVTFNVVPGEFVAVLGKSGSGKSTLLRCINRLVEPTKGSVFLGDDEITGASPSALRLLRRKIGMIFQQYNLVNRLTVWTNTMTGDLGVLPQHQGLDTIVTVSKDDHGGRRDQFGAAISSVVSRVGIVATVVTVVAPGFAHLMTPAVRSSSIRSPRPVSATTSSECWPSVGAAGSRKAVDEP